MITPNKYDTMVKSKSVVTMSYSSKLWYDQSPFWQDPAATSTSMYSSLMHEKSHTSNWSATIAIRQPAFLYIHHLAVLDDRRLVSGETNIATMKICFRNDLGVV
jgi:hypothetical protein